MYIILYVLMHDCIKFGAVFEYSHVYSHIRVALKMNIGNHHLQTLLFSESYPDSSSSHTYLPVSTPNTIHHSRLTVCLPDSLDLDRCLSILFWLSACE